MSEKKKILVLDGGGIKGVVAASFLATLEEATGKSIADYFDLVVGTSTGGILALGLGMGMRPAEIVSFYEQDGPRIFSQLNEFDKPVWWQRFLNKLSKNARAVKHLAKPKYTSEMLTDALTRAFGNKRLGDSKLRLVIPSFFAETNELYVFKTRHAPRFEHDHLKSVVEVAKSTAAAPTYFESHQYSSGGSLLDGGVYANNPVGVAITEAIGVLDWDRKNTFILRLGCTQEAIDTTSIKGKMDAGQIIDLMFRAQSEAANGMAYLLTGHTREQPKYFPIQPTVAKNQYQLDGTNKIKALKGIGHSEARNALPMMREYFLDERVEPFIPYR
jgi:patatin-like phospholipase/acyl hydrolase